MTPEVGVEPTAKRSMTVSEAAALLGISRAFAYELVARRELPALRLGRRIIVSRKAVEAMLDAPPEPTA